MAVFTKKTAANGQVQYRKDGTLVSPDAIDELVLAKLDSVSEGTPVPEDGEIDTDVVPEAPAPEPTDDTVRIHLGHTICVNGKAYRGGVEIDEESGEKRDVYITVEKDVAEDLKRIDDANTECEQNLFRDNGNSREPGHRPQDINLPR